MKWSRLLCLAGPIFLVAVVIKATNVATTSGSASGTQKLPLCPPVHTEVSGKVVHSNLLLVSTLDGQMTALDMDKSGAHLWSVATGPGPMLSSTISQVELTNNAQFVKLIPSLAGGIYKFDGHSVEPVPMTAEALLKASFKFADNTVMTGGKESRTYGIDLKTGRIIYECTLQGCTRDPREPEDEMEDVLVVQRESQTVRAIEPRTGSEKWNFSVSQHHIQFHPSIEEMCEATVSDEVNEDDESEVADDTDFSLQDEGKEIKAVVSEGIICQTQKDDILWRHAFPSPIVHAWRLINGKLTKVNLFSNSHIPRRDLPPASEDDDENSAAANSMPLIYIGSYKNQLYIQESERQRKKSSKLPNEHQLLPYSEYPRVAWRPYLISASSRTPIINHGSGPPSGMPLLTHDKKTAENTALAVIADAGSDYPFDSGLYLFPDEPNLDYDIVEDYKNKSRKIIKPDGTELEFEPDSELSLWNWWKEVVFISIFTALMMNLLITQPAINRIRENFRMTLERISRRQPNVLVVERRIEVPYEVKVEVPVPQLSREESCGSSNTTVGSGSNRPLEFVSRFLTDYEPLRCLGFGGFGVVFESKNKIDDVHYAVKRVQLPLREEAKKKVMREVKFLAKLDHKNIVRYYNTWLECPPTEWQKTWDAWWQDTESESGLSPLNSVQNGSAYSASAFSPFQNRLKSESVKELEEEEESENPFLPNYSSKIDDSFDIVFENSNKNAENKFEDDNFEEDSTSGGIVFENNSNVNNSDLSKKSKPKMSKFAKFNENQSSLEDSSSQDVCEAIVWDESKRPRSYLYIVMQLCQKESLRHWLKTNWTLDSSLRTIKAKAIFHEICLGVEYVHAQGLIHRDLKPSNIFFSSDGTVKIGDFGLVTGVHGGPECPSTSSFTSSDGDNNQGSFANRQKDFLSTKATNGGKSKLFDTEYEEMSELVDSFGTNSFTSPRSNCRKASQQHTDQVGTELYMSPEQLAHKRYSHKVDIYSLGVILFELLVPFQTQMERVHSLRAIRNLNFPPNFPETPESLLVRSMVSHDPEIRPDASEILKKDFMASEHFRRDSDLMAS